MKKLLTLATLSCALLVAACGSSEPAEPETIKLGFIGPLTGDAAAYGVDTLNAMQLRIDELNAAGGIDGKQIEIIAEDGRCGPSDAAAAAQKLVNINKVIAIIGGVCSGETLAAAPIAEAGGVPMISPSSTSPDVTDAGEFIFRTVPSDALKTEAMAQHFRDQGWEKIAIINENTDFCVAFRDSLEENMGTSFVFNETVEPGSKDYRTLVTRLKDVEFDAVVMNGNSVPAVAAMLNQLHELGIEQTPVSHDVGDSPEIIALAPDGSEGLQTINVPNLDSSSAFGRSFTAKYGDPKGVFAFAGAAYDGTNMLINAISSGAKTGPEIRDYLANLRNFAGVTGQLGFDANGDIIGINYKLSEVQSGTFVTLADIEL